MGQWVSGSVNKNFRFWDSYRICELCEFVYWSSRNIFSFPDRSDNEMKQMRQAFSIIKLIENIGNNRAQTYLKTDGFHFSYFVSTLNKTWQVLTGSRVWVPDRRIGSRASNHLPFRWSTSPVGDSNNVASEPGGVGCMQGGCKWRRSRSWLCNWAGRQPGLFFILALIRDNQRGHGIEDQNMQINFRLK